MLVSEQHALMSRGPEHRWRSSLLLTGAVIALSLGSSQLQALDPSKPLHQANCRVWNYQNGLPVTGILALGLDREGCLWLGTRRGLLSFDGVEFSLVGTPPASELRTTRVQALCPSRRGGIWFGLRRSAFGLRTRDGQWWLGRDPQYDMGWDVPCLLEAKDGTLWVGGEYAAHGPAEPVRLERIFPEGSEVVVISMLEDSQGRVWLGTSRHGLYYWQDGKVTKLPDPDLDNRIIHALAEDKAGQLWLGTHMGLMCYDAELQHKAENLPEYEVRCLHTDQHGALWIGTTGNGLVRAHNGSFETLTKADGLTANSILALTEDNEGNIWIGTAEGLNQLTDVKLATLSTKDGLPLESALSVSVSPRGGLWIGTAQGAVYWKDGQASAYSVTNGLKFAYVKRVLEATNGDVFIISGRNELEIISGETVVARHRTDGMPVALVEDARGVVVSVAGALFRASRDAVKPLPFAEGSNPELQWVMNLALGRDGAIWAATVNGLFRIKDGRFQRWAQSDGLADANIRWVFEESDGTVWLGTATGMARMKNGQIHNLRQNDGLPDANLYSVTPDAHGQLWVDSLGGIYRLSKQNVDDYFSGRVTRLDIVAYMTPEAVKPGDKQSQEATACQTADGRIWFPGPKGVVVVDPANLPVNTIVPTVQLRYVSAGGIKLDRSKPLVLPPGQRNVEFAYTAFSYTSPRQVRFRYRLEGHDADWTETEERRLAAYANLKPGRYVFRVTACNADGRWNSVGDSISLTLRPHFYQTDWFAALGGVLGLGGLLGIYGWRVRQLRRRQLQLQEAREILEARVAERTAELARSNALLVTEIEERKRMQQEVERVHAALMVASREAGQAEVAASVLHNVGNVLNSVNVSTGLVAERVRKLRVANLAKAAQLLDEHSADLAAFLAEDAKGRQLPQYLRELAEYLSAEQTGLLAELKGLAGNVDHIKEIVAMQLAYTKAAGVLEQVELAEVVEDALKMQSDSLLRRGVQIERAFEAVPPVTVDRHKVLQVLSNLLRNAGQACEAGGSPEKRITARISRTGANRVRIEIRDNGVGIAPENLTRIFQHGFTTRKGGHGFGLHSAALAAREMGGTLTVQSEGSGHGATFTLELPPPPGGTGCVNRKTAGNCRSTDRSCLTGPRSARNSSFSPETSHPSARGANPRIRTDNLLSPPACGI